MIERIINFSVRRRWLVLLITPRRRPTVLVADELPIDAVPMSLTFRCRSTVAPALTPVEIETVRVALETVLAGTPGRIDAFVFA
jgi:cobalt-zinc-cadmium resistance protein CzcA